MSDWRAKVAAAKLPERVVPIVMAGDLAAEHERLTAELEQARERKSGSLAGSGTGALEEELQRIENEAADSVVEFRLRALPRTRRPGDPRPSWPEFKKQHPPRYENDQMVFEDRVAGGVNAETVAEPLARLCIVEPDDITDADWLNIMASMSDAQFDVLAKTAWDLNQGSVDIPFSRVASATNRTSSPE